MSIKRRTIADRIKLLGPCPGAMEQAAKYTSPTIAWREWPNGGDMLWLIFEAGRFQQGDAGHRRAILCACECFRTGLIHAGNYRLEVEAVYDALERWAKGDDSADLKTTAAAAWNTDAAARRAAYAAWSTVEAAVAARRAAYAALSTADAAYAARSTAVAARRAADAAWSTAEAAYAARSTAIAARRAADAAWSTANAARSTADAAVAARSTAYYVLNTADECNKARADSERAQAELVRKHYPKPPRIPKESTNG